MRFNKTCEEEEEEEEEFFNHCGVGNRHQPPARASVLNSPATMPGQDSLTSEGYRLPQPRGTRGWRAHPKDGLAQGHQPQHWCASRPDTRTHPLSGYRRSSSHPSVPSIRPRPRPNPSLVGDGIHMRKKEDKEEANVAAVLQSNNC